MSARAVHRARRRASGSSLIDFKTHFWMKKIFPILMPRLIARIQAELLNLLDEQSRRPA